jgi:hypothetical protein
MSNDSNVWLVLILVGGLVVAVALFLGRGLIVRKSREGLSIEVEKHQLPVSPAPPSQGIEVARGAQIERSTVGDISGVKLEGDAATEARDLRVFQQGRLEGSQAGDISGVKKTRPPGDGGT